MSAQRWHSHDGRWTPASNLTVGDLVAVEREAWRITDIRDDGKQLHIGAVKVNRLDDRPHTLTIDRYRGLTKLDEHYSVCVKCGELQPCREQDAAHAAEAAVQRAERHSLAGVCPACLEAVTSRQASVTFDENVMMPLGPAITFHLRRKCLSSAIRYDQTWAKDLGVTPKLEESLTCDGALYRHRDGATTCTSLDCPSIKARHGYWAQCFTRSAGCPRFECQFGTAAA